jgi:hypothetical protein
MKTKLFVVFALALVLAGGHLFAGAFAKSVKFTFNQAVQVPGMTLPAGTYVFERSEVANRNRDVMRVMGENGKPVAQFLIVANEELSTIDRSTLRFSEQNRGEARAIQSIGYAGETVSFSPVYGRAKAVPAQTIAD